MVNNLRIGPQGLHRNQLVFSVESGTGSEAIHIVELVRPITIQASEDSVMYSKNPNQNEGAHSPLLIGRDRGPLRSVISFTLRGISPASVNQAGLILELQEPVTGLRNAGQSLQVRPLLERFDEGNGKSYGLSRKARESGSGTGVTWNCAVDGNIANKGFDCDVMWLGSDFIAGPFTDAVDHVNGQTGQVTWDVTLNVLQVLANGKTEVNWLVRFANESANGMVKYYSKEGAAQNQNYSLGPQLVLAP